ncbi:lipopolysaccharide assembly protein LapB [Thiohalophilus thiocyanatoxydans]|uniref:Lipopolysaccharide assembly protein B n=1 Tax=Thiohalophilus thiocyanatoxydans TaxID=381308 RepID=A0A4R8IQ25_9GAMM|nr:lipopolysaccharide assembly protein LapB [Thiohalophilus thiocyanatoxydans]TDY02658.1 lipopolysaccharide biosynthesis regulator YciM [Thiohalophilus thiocyanatoxydans]
MGIEILFLLLPVAALSGWWLGRRGRIQRENDSGLELPSDYIKGLNYILNEQQDKAIDLFIQMLDVNSETVETHLALGSLFRRRGEVDRAIRIHQNLIARPTLNKSQRALALFELGQDYMRAGLLDRAESLFGELVDSAPHSEAALHHLVEIYQQEKDWGDAIKAAQRLEQSAGLNLAYMVAQFYCEQADQALRQGEPSRALKLLRRAMNEDRQCVRASIMEGDIERSAGNYKAALKAYQRIEQQDPEYLSEVIQPMLECYRALQRTDDAINYFNTLLEKYAGISCMLVLADLIEMRDGEQAATEFITRFLKQRPSVRGMDRLIELNMGQASESVRDKLHVLKEVTDQILANKSVYTCQHCGFSGKSLHWQCPSCKHWNTIRPIHGVEGE